MMAIIRPMDEELHRTSIGLFSSQLSLTFSPAGTLWA